MSNLVKKLQTQHYTTTCRKKKGVKCRFNAPWAPSDKTRIAQSKEKIDKTIVKQIKKYNDKLLSYIVSISDLSDVPLSEILEKVWSYIRTIWQCIRMCGKRSLYYINENHVK